MSRTCTGGMPHLPYHFAQLAGALVPAAVTGWIWANRCDLRAAPTL